MSEITVELEDPADSVGFVRETMSDDIPPTTEDDLTCEVCGKPLIYGGRGRKPTRCDEHKRNKATGGGTRRSNSKLGALEANLKSNFSTIGTMVFMVNQFDGQVILERSEDLAKSLVAVAEQNPKVRQALENMMTASAWSQVVMVGASIAIPIAANHGLLPSAVMNTFARNAATNTEDVPDASAA